MKRLLKWTGIGCGGLVGLIIIIGVISAIAGSGKSGGQTAPASSGSGQAAVSQSASTKASPSPSQSAAAVVPKVGERIESSGVALTVNSVRKADKLGTVWTPKAGNVYLVVDVTVENTSRDKAPYNPLYFRVKASDDYEYNTALADEGQGLKSGELAAGEKARGTVTFDVPATAKGFVLSYQPLVILGGYKTIRIALE